MQRRRFCAGRGSAPARQRVLPFLERRRRLDRWFKRGIVALTILCATALIAGTKAGRYLSRRVAVTARDGAIRLIGLPPDRAVIDARWRNERLRGVEQASATYRAIYGDVAPELRRLIDYGGLGPDQAVIRWGNYDRILLLPSSAFMPDDSGRSYRLRPHTRSVWLKAIDLPDSRLRGFFLMPDTDELPRLLKGTPGYIVPGSSQTTNSWGCRGPEPELDAPIRGLILGDSNMEGLLVGDQETPPERLRCALAARLRARVSVLNTGVLGYSPEQIYYTLLEYAPRFRPNFVLFSFCPNDFGSAFEKHPNPADIEEGQYWLGQILDYCRARNILFVATAVPDESHLTALRLEGHYPGRICDLLPINSLRYCNPMDAFADEHLRLVVELDRKGRRPAHSPLFNGAHSDGHMSAAGAALWGEALAHRLVPLLEGERLHGRIAF